MLFGSILGIIGIGLSAVSTIFQFQAGKERSKALDRAAEANNRAEAEQRKQNNLRLFRQKRETIRQARIARARAVSAATIRGASGSVRGGFGSITSQASSNINFLNRSTAFANQGSIFRAEAASFKSQAAQAGSRVSLFSGLASLGGTIFSNREGVESIFKDLDIIS